MTLASGRNTRRLAYLTLGLLVVAGTAAATGCSSDSSNNPGSATDTVYQGTIVGALGESGFIEVTVTTPAAAMSSGGVMIAAAASKPATGRMKLDGGCENQLTGTLSGTALVMTGTGTCGNYDLTGAVSGSQIAGTFTAASGHTGTFVCEESTGSNSVTVFCGRWVEVVSGTPTGTEGPWNMVVKSSSIQGVAYDPSDTAIPLTGTRTGDGVTILAGGTQIATGTISGTQISGIYDIGSSAGTWSGQVCQ